MPSRAIGRLSHDTSHVQVGGMMRALEYFTRALFTGGQGDLCAQFLYADLSSTSLGAAPFSPHLSEEELNDLLCGEVWRWLRRRKGYVVHTFIVSSEQERRRN